VLPLSLVALVVAAVSAGVLTTISGFGGGLVLLVAVAALEGPKTALAATAIGLLVANAHRIWLYRRHIHAEVTVPLLVGVVPGAFVGALLAALVPASLIQIAMLGMIGLGLARAWFGWAWRPGRETVGISGAIVGVLGGSAGGVGNLLGPIVLAAGLTGRRYLGTLAVTVVAMYVARIVGYGAGGLMTREVLLVAALLTPALLVGNLLGDWLRDLVSDLWQRRIEVGAAVLCVAHALAGLG
jgi:uncharacterized membrane protein YfcA